MCGTEREQPAHEHQFEPPGQTVRERHQVRFVAAYPVKEEKAAERPSVCRSYPKREARRFVVLQRVHECGPVISGYFAIHAGATAVPIPAP